MKGQKTTREVPDSRTATQKKQPKPCVSRVFACDGDVDVVGTFINVYFLCYSSLLSICVGQIFNLCISFCLYSV